jgi:hypothetical protein
VPLIVARIRLDDLAALLRRMTRLYPSAPPSLRYCFGHLMTARQSPMHVHRPWRDVSVQPLAK